MLGNNERYMEQQGGELQKRITDSFFRIYGKEKVGKYHVETQSKPDSSMLIRMFEYGTQIALEDAELLETELKVEMPKAAVIYLRCTKNTPDTLKTTIGTPDGAITYDVPILKLKNYSIEKIFEKKLLFFIPYYILLYENKILEYNKTKEGVKMIKERMEYIFQCLDKLVDAGEIDEYTRQCIMGMTKKVVEHVTEKYENIKKGIGEVMGGKILNYEAKDIYNAGKSEGIQLGKSEGIRLGMNVCISLIKDGLLSFAEAAKRLGMTEEELKMHM